MISSHPVVHKIFWVSVLVLGLMVTRDIVLAPNDLATMTKHTVAGHEWQYNIWRMVGMADSLMDGMPGRWVDNFSHGWGYPIFHYTGPIPYLTGSILITLGVEPVSALNFSWVAVFLLSGCAMFWATYRFFGYWGALLATICYLFAPYHLVDTYIRTNLVETSAFMFPPLVIRGLWYLQHSRKQGIVCVALGVMALPLTHLLTTYLVGIGLSIFVLTYSLFMPKGGRLPFLISAGSSALVGLLLSAFFWLGAVGDISAIRGFDAIVDGYYGYTNHFVYFHQLFDPAWHYGASEIGPRDYMSFSLGRTIVGLTSLSLVCVIWYTLSVWRTSSKGVLGESSSDSLAHSDTPDPDEWGLPRQFFGFFISALFAALFVTFMTLHASEPLWKLFPKLEAAQFPWRFLLSASFFFALCAGALPRSIGIIFPRHKNIMAALIGLAGGLVVLSAHWNYAKVGGYGTIPMSDMTEEHHYRVGVWTTNALEFMPVGVEHFPHRGTTPKVDAYFQQLTGERVNRVLNSTREHGKIRISLVPGSEGQLVINQHYHPGWRASVDGKPVSVEENTAHPYAPMMVNVPEDASEVEVRFGFTKLGGFGVFLSICSTLLMLVFLLVFRRDVALGRTPFVILIVVLVYQLFYFFTSVPETASRQAIFNDIGLQVDKSELPKQVMLGSQWDAPGNIQFDKSGVFIDFGQAYGEPILEVSVDSNDTYLIGFMKGRNLLSVRAIGIANHGGMAIHNVDIPTIALEKEYDGIAIIPVNGDTRYSVGHVMLRSERSSNISGRREKRADFSPVQVDANDLPHLRRPGRPWNEAGNRIFNDRGIAVNFEDVQQRSQLNVSFDSNDHYALYFVLDGQLIDSMLTPLPKVRRGGMANRIFELPESVQSQGFDRLVILPFGGDGRYSLGHIR